MRISVCGIACEKCPRLTRGTCPRGEQGCTPKQNPFCKVCTCAFEKGVRYCFECADFPCEVTRLGPIHWDYCQYIAGKAG